MLVELRIQDLAVIDRLALRLEPGLNVLTGETGAGKSIIVGALSLLMGERASTDAVRPGTERAVVEGVFEVEEDGDVARLLAEQGIDVEDGMVILRREVAAEGRNRAWINGAATTATIVGRVGGMLLGLHGQSEHEDLLRPDRQREILDAYAGGTALAADVATAHEELRNADAALATLDERRREVEGRADLLRHQATEIEDAKLRPGEEDELEAEARRLDHAEELARLSSQLHDALYAAEDSLVERLGRARRALGQLLQIDPDASDAAAALDEAFFVIEDLGRRMGDYASSVEHDPARLDALRARQDLLFRLKSRYGPTLDDVIAAGRRARAEIDQLDSVELERSELARRSRDARDVHRARCAELSRLRADAASRLSKAVAELLPSLGMTGGRFEIALNPVTELGARGAESIEFRVALNTGFEPRPLARVASGGELARLMLALKAILATADATPTLIFDEIDAGIGGRVAHAVGDKLAAVSREHQVLVVTHLAQIAARADHHLLVEKSEQREERASTRLRELTGEARVHELARLLGGDPESAASLDHARDLLAAPSR